RRPSQGENRGGGEGRRAARRGNGRCVRRRRLRPAHNMFEPALRLLLDTAFGLVTYGFLLRFAMQWLRAPFRNPLGQAVVALTDWAVKPVRSVVPGFNGVDASTLLLAWVAELAWLCAIALLVGPGPFDGTVAATFALLACVEI